MLAEKMLTNIVKNIEDRELVLVPATEKRLPDPKPGMRYMLYLHVPFCERLCPFCSFNRYPYRESIARPYFEHLRREMMMLKEQGYDFESLYFGGGTPTIMLDELCRTIDLARENFHIKEVSCETNPNHLTKKYFDALGDRVQRLSVGVQSFDDGLLKQMDRYDKYGSGEEIFERIGEANQVFDSLNVDMIFNFPSQTEDILFSDLEKIALCGCRQTTFSPLYVSRATTCKMHQELGNTSYDREYRLYQIVDGVLAGGDDAQFDRTTLWTFNRKGTQAKPQKKLPVEEYAVSYDEYPAIGSGSISHLGGRLYVNDFSISNYDRDIDEGRAPLMGECACSKRDFMRYDFLIHLYNLRLDKRAFKRKFGCSVTAGLPGEMAFMRLNAAFATDNADELTLTPRGRYLVLVIYREFLSGMNNLRDQARAALSGKEKHLLFGDGVPAEIDDVKPSRAVQAVLDRKAHAA